MNKYLYKTILVSLAILSGLQAAGQNDSAMKDTLQAASITAMRDASTAIIAKVEHADFRPILAPFGGSDAIGYVKFLPGIASGVEGSNSFYVRGGNNGNNLVTIDGVTLYGTGHLLGFTSAVSSSIVQSTEFFKGGYDSKVGNFTSSHLSLSMKEGDLNKESSSVEVSNVMIGGTYSTPLIDDKLSLIVGGRISPIQWEYNAFSDYFRGNNLLPNEISAWVYDLYAKAKYLYNSRSVFTFTAFGSQDSYGFNFSLPDLSGTAPAISKDKIGWNNMIFVGEWKYTLNKWNFTTNLSYNRFNSKQIQGRRIFAEAENTEIGISSLISEGKLSAYAEYEFDVHSALQFGLEERYSFFNPGAQKVFASSSAINPANNNKSNVNLTALHAQYEYAKGKFSLRASARGTLFLNKGKSYLSPEGRIYLDYKIMPKWGVEMTADHTVQFYHTLEGIPTGFSTDLIVPAGEYAPPQTADQFYIGTYAQLGAPFKFSLGGFYKIMDNLVYFKEASKIFSSSALGWIESIDVGEGTSYGLEFYGESRSKYHSLKLAYTYSKTDRVFPNINEGEVFPFQFDRTHILNLNGEIHFLKTNRATHSLIGTFTYNTGHLETLASGSYYADYVPGIERFEVSYYKRPNNYRVPDYIRLDLGYQVLIKGENSSHSLTLGCFNVLNRHNTYSLYWDSSAAKWKKVSILPLMPNIVYKVEF